MSNRGHNGLKLQQILPQVSQDLSGQSPFVPSQIPRTLRGRRSHVLGGGCPYQDRSSRRRSRVLGGGCSYRDRSPWMPLPGSHRMPFVLPQVPRTWWGMYLPGSRVLCGKRQDRHGGRLHLRLSRPDAPRRQRFHTFWAAWVVAFLPSREHLEGRVTSHTTVKVEPRAIMARLLRCATRRTGKPPRNSTCVASRIQPDVGQQPSAPHQMPGTKR